MMVPILYKMLRPRFYTRESCQITCGWDPERLSCIAESIFKFLVELWGTRSISHIYALQKYDVWIWLTRKRTFLSYFTIILHLLTSLSDADCYNIARKSLDPLFVFKLCTLLCSPPSVSGLSRKMWKPWRLTSLWASTACYRGSFTFTLLCE
jgi:hypothetical protein